jgi:site-specific DNA recombinase
MSAPLKRCALYTRKSSEEGLDQEFNSLDAQREACEAYVKSQASEGWRQIDAHYDDGGISGGTMERPALQHLLSDIAQGKVDVVVVYKIDRLTRALADFARMVELFDRHDFRRRLEIAKGTAICHLPKLSDHPVRLKRFCSDCDYVTAA